MAAVLLCQAFKNRMETGTLELLLLLGYIPWVIKCIPSFKEISCNTSFQRVWNALRLRLSNLMIVECEPYEFLKEGAAELVAMLVEATCIFIRLVLTTLWPIPKLVQSSRIWLLLGFLKLCEFPTLLNWSQLLVCDLLITNCTITESLQHDAWCIFSDCAYLFRERSYKLTRMQNGDPTSFLLRLLVRNEPTRKDEMCGGTPQHISASHSRLPKRTLMRSM